MPGRGQRLVESAQDHGEDEAKGIVEPRDGLIEQRRVLAERSHDPRMRELKQRRAARA